MKEWEMLADVYRNKFDLKILSSLEEKLDVKTLWPSVISNRRVFFGPNYAFRQDYETEFTHEEILSLQTIFYERIQKLFDDYSPEIIFSFICTTTQEYICDELSRQHKFPHLN